MKKLAACLLALMMTFALVACGAANSTSTGTASSAVQQASSSASTSDSTEPDAQQKDLTFGLTMVNTKEDIFARMVADFKALGEKDGINVITNDANGDAATQVNAIENFIVAGCDVICVQAVDANALVDVLAKAKDQGIKVVCVFVPLNEGSFDVKYGNDSKSIGTSIAELAIEYLQGQYGTEEEIKVVTETITTTSSTQERSEWMEKVLTDGTNITIVDRGYPTDTENANSVTTNLIMANPDIKAVVCGWDHHGIGAYSAIEALGRQNDIAVFGADGNMVSIGYINDDTHYKGTAALNSNSFGSDIYEMAYKLATDAPDAYESAFTKPVKVTIENAAEWLQ